eukprot:114045-Amphidinium_carterae.1
MEFDFTFAGVGLSTHQTMRTPADFPLLLGGCHKDSWQWVLLFVHSEESAFMTCELYRGIERKDAPLMKLPLVVGNTCISLSHF